MEGITEQSSGENLKQITPEKTASFQHYIFEGGMMIKEGKYQEAITHFRNKEELAKVGRRIVPATEVILNEKPEPDKYRSLADQMAKLSMNKDGGTVEISDIKCYMVGSDGLPRIQNQVIPKELQHEIALVAMEEWLHSLQDIRIKPLAGQLDHEIDVALYMQKNTIPMTEAFKARYGRGVALEKLKTTK
jgi:hypothetical protein